LLFIGLAASIVGCADSKPLSDASASSDMGPVSVELGWGSRPFEEVPAVGGDAPLVHGPQGGFHILGRLRMRGLSPDVYVSFRLSPAEGGALVNDPLDRVRRIDGRGLTRVGDAWESSAAELVVLTAIRGPGEVDGRRFRWEVVVEEAGTGRVATAAREVTIVDAP
jgi:hypothetical protein